MKFSLVDTTFLEKAMDAAVLRQQVTSNNLANANVAGYTARSVDFEGHLRQAMANEEEDGFEMASVVDPELDFQAGPGDWNKSNLSATVADTGQGVDVSREMSNMAKSQIMYNALTRKVSGVYSSLKWVIENSR